jgi:hypothetical protein
MEDQLIIIVWFTYFRLFLATTGVSVTAVSKIEVREPFPYIIFYSQLQGNKQTLKGNVEQHFFRGLACCTENWRSLSWLNLRLQTRERIGQNYRYLI